MIAISIACGLVICLFQFDAGEATGQDWSRTSQSSKRLPRKSF